MIKIALSKGRLAKETLKLLSQIGIKTDYNDDSRKLLFTSEDESILFFLAKPLDVPIFVEQGAADIGVAGYDTIMEERLDVYQVIDLGFGKCSFCVAGFKKIEYKLQSSDIIKVATKYPNTCADYFEKSNRRVSIIKLNGSVELAPLVGLSDVIFDIVESGKTLKENNLDILEESFNISSRLIVNKASLKVKYEEIYDLINKIKDKLGED